MGAFADKFSAWSDAYRLLAAAHPVPVVLYLLSMALLILLFAVSLARGRTRQAFWCVIGLFLVNIGCASGEDIEIHIYRTIVIADQVRHGALSLLVSDVAAGDSLPVFAFYGFTPYLLPGALDLTGLSGHLSVTLSLCLTFLILALGVGRVVESMPEEGDRAASLHRRYLAAILFVSANYVLGLWTQRSALAEIWVYALVPWVVVALSAPRRKWLLTALLFLQLSMHPVVFAHGFICALVVAIGLSREAPAEIVRRCAAPFGIAVVLGLPFWLPPFLFKGAILGLTALPIRFEDTFLSIGDLLSRRHMRNLGLCLPLAVVVAAVGFRPASPWRFRMLAAGFVFAMLLQTTILRDLALDIPLLHYSVFVWRLMLPAAFVAFGALLAMGAARVPALRPALAALALLSTVNAMVILLGGAPAAIGYSVTAPDDASELRDYAGRNKIWGRREYMPDYSGLPTACESEAPLARFEDVRKGVAVTTPYVRIPNGPVGPVTYAANGQRLPPKTCDGDLVLGPLPAGATVQASEGDLTWLLLARVACVIAALAMLGVGMAGRPARAPAP